MTEGRREVILAPAALQRMMKDNPSDEELEAVKNVLKDLGANPLLGYEVPFLRSKTYRFDAGRFHLHYKFDDGQVLVGFIGVY